MHNHALEKFLIYIVSEAKKGKKYRVIQPEEFWTPKRKAWDLRQTESLPNEEEVMRFMSERLGPAWKRNWERRVKEREQKAKLAGQKDFKPV